MTSERRLVVMPTYDEAANLELVIDRIRASVPAVDVLVVDDASPDGTGDVADKMAHHDAQVHVLHRQQKEGLGAAYVAGFRWGTEHGYDVLIEMDADGSHLPEQLPRLLDVLPQADLVLGTRWMPGGRVVNWPRRRELLSRGGNLYARLALGVPLRDATSGFRAFRAATLQAIGYDDVSSEGYCFQVELATRAVRAGLRVVEVPITFVEREYGESKMTGEVVRESLVKVSRWGAERRIRQAARLVDNVRGR